jgi:hypothetical protein
MNKCFELSMSQISNSNQKGKSLIVLSKEITQWLDLWFGHAAAMKLLWRVCCPFGSTHKAREISLCNCAQRIPGSLLSEKFLVRSLLKIREVLRVLFNRELPLVGGWIWISSINIISKTFSYEK